MRYTCMCTRPVLVLDPHAGEWLCGRCGTVIESKLAESHIQDAGSLDGGREDYGVGTILPGEAGAASIAARRSREGVRLNNLLSVLRRMLESVGAGEAIAGEAYAICRRLVAAGHPAGRDKKSIAAAILMLACRTRGRVLEWGDIPGMADKTRRMMKAYRELQYASISAPAHYTEALISRLCTDMDLPVYVARDAIHILDNMRAVRFTGGKKPQCVAATAVVLACQEAGQSIPKREAAYVAGVSEMGLRNLLAAWNTIQR